MNAGCVKLIFIVFFLLMKKKLPKPETQNDDIQKLKDRVEELEKDKEKKE